MVERQSHGDLTLTPEGLADKNSVEPARAVRSEGPPRMGPARVAGLFLEPGEFFTRLERGRPRLRAMAGGFALLSGAAVQGASWHRVLPGASSGPIGAIIGVLMAATFVLYLGVVYRSALRASGVQQDIVQRVGPVLGYGFVPMALAWIPWGGLPIALGTAAAAHAKGLEHYLGLPGPRAQAIVLMSWGLFVIGLAAVAGQLA